MRFGPRFLRLTCLLLIPAVAPFAAETTDSPSPLPKTVAVAAFKNGLAFVIRQGEVPLIAGTGRITPIPNATLGTLWLSTSTLESKLDEIVAYRYSIAGDRAIPSIREILLANSGKTVTISYQMKEYTGEIVGLRDSRASDAGPSVLPEPEPNPDTRPSYLLLRVNKNLMTFPLAGINLATLPDDAVLREHVERPQQALRFKVKGGGPKENLTMGYLEHGIGWTPSYLISLADDTHAQITMQAVVTNDVEDIQDADLFFVVGVPNFAYANIPSPMSLQQSLMDFMRDAKDAVAKKSFGMLSNALQAQVVAVDEREAAPISLTPSVDELSGAPEEDLFLYNRSGVTLAKGERASYSIFSGNIACEHIYNWEIEDQPRVDLYGNVINNPNAQDGNRADSVWHAIRLKNSTKFPWTSAPALVISGDKPVSQDTLSYTPKGASSTLNITIATDIRASHEEREVARQQDPTHRRNYPNYDLVTVEGRLKVKNYKSKEARLSISKTLRGKVESQSDEGKVVQLAEGIESDNPRSRLTWEILLKPGEERAVTYQYKIWVRV